MNLSFELFKSGENITKTNFSQILKNSNLDIYFVLHGFLGRGKNWNFISKSLSKTLPNIFINFDLRNHGKSKTFSNINYHLMSDDLFDFLKQFQIKKISIIGHSMGGKVGMLFSLNYESLVKNLIIVDIAPIKYKNEDNNFIKKLLELDLTTIYTRKDAELILSKKMNNVDLISFLLQNLEKADNHYKWSIDLKILKKAINELKSFPHINKKNFLTNVLIIYSANEEYVNSRNLKSFNKYFKNIQLNKISGVGHWIHYQKPEEFIQKILKFIK